mgnify:CR=1 FL=1
MRTMIATRFGAPDVLELQQRERPQPKRQQLLVQVVATSVNPVDYKIRDHGQDFGLEPPRVLGFDCSGKVVETGEDVTRFKEGDEVFFLANILDPNGCNAEYHVVDEATVAPKPAHLSHEDAASLPLAGGTAWQALVDRAGVCVGDRVLIHGAGGVGSLAAQIAVAAGAEVYLSCSDYMVDVAQNWGVKQVINYKTEDFVEIVNDATDGAGVEIVFNTAGGDLLNRSVPVAAAFGTLVGILELDHGLEGAYRKNLSIELLFLQRDVATLRGLSRLAAAGQLEPVVDSVIPLADLPEAHRRLEQGGVKGKIVVCVEE